MSDNSKTLDAGFKKAKELIFQHLQKKLEKIATTVVDSVYAGKEYLGFTGNAQTSYTFMLFNGKGMLREYQADNRSPIHEMIPFKESLHLIYPFEGKERTREGKVDLRGKEYSEENIAEIRLIPSKLAGSGLSVRFAIGVPYYMWLQPEGEADPLENMYLLSKSLLSGLK